MSSGAMERFWRGQECHLKSRPKQVRVYFSSNLADSVKERIYISEVVYPELVDYFLKEYNLEFQIVDMRWKSSVRNNTKEISLNEIQNCRNDSIGPFFISFLSHKYGDKLLLPEIKEHEFGALKKEINAQKFKNTYEGKLFKTKRLLEHCYKLDRNQIPAVYRLLSLEAIIPGYDSAINDSLNEWTNVESQLKYIIQKSATSLYTKGEFSIAQKNQFYISITESEIKEGIFSLSKSDAAKRTLVIIRDISPAKNSKSIESYDTFMLNDLKSKLKNYLPQSNVIHLKKRVSPDHATVYFKTLGDLFKSNIISLFKKYHEKSTSLTSSYFKKANEKLGEDLIFQYSIRDRLADSYKLKDNHFKEVAKYVKSSSQSPLFVHGESGSGKSHLMAFVAKNIFNIVADPAKTIVIFQFSGSTKSASNLHSIYLSIISQLKWAFKLNSSEQLEKESLDLMKKLSGLSVSQVKDYLVGLLESLNNKFPTKRVFICIDGVEQLVSDNEKDDRALDWLIYKCPLNTKVIYSVLEDDKKNVFKSMRKHVKDKRCFVKLKRWSTYASLQALNEELLGSGRRLTIKQTHQLTDLFNQAELTPLYVKLISDIVSKWPSHSNKSTSDFFDKHRCINARTCLRYIFKQLEEHHGTMLIARLTFYMNQFSWGVSEKELVDVLSLDKDLLKVVVEDKSKNTKPVFPIALWISVKFEIQKYLRVKSEHDTQVFGWLHDILKQVTKELYDDSLSVIQRDLCLMNIYQYFTANEDCETSGPSQRKNQSLMLYSETNNTVIFNQRKLGELPQLIVKFNSPRLQEYLLKEDIFFDFDFLYAKTLLNDFAFLNDLKQTIWTLYNSHRLDLELSIYMNSPPEKGLNPMRDLVALYIVFSELFSCIKNNPQSLIELLRSRLYDFTKDQTRLAMLLNHMDKQGINPLVQKAIDCQSRTGSIVPLRSFLPPMDFQLNEKLSSILHRSSEILFWPGVVHDVKILFMFDSKAKRITLYNYQTERMVNHIDITMEWNDPKTTTKLLKTMILNEGLDDGGLVDGSEFCKYYFLLSGFDVLVYKAQVKEGYVHRLSLEDLQDVFKQKYKEYTPDQFPSLLLENFIPIANHYILVLDKQLTISSASRPHAPIFTQTFNNRIISHTTNIEKNFIATPKPNGRVFILLSFEDGAIKLYEMSNLSTLKPAVRLVLNLPCQMLERHGVLSHAGHQNNPLSFCFDRSFSLNNQQIGRQPSNNSIILRFLLNIQSDFFLFEVLNEHLDEIESAENRQKTFRVKITYRIRKFTFSRPVCIDLYGDTLLMISRHNMRPVCYNIASKKILKLNVDLLNGPTRGVDIISAHTLLVHDQRTIFIFKLSQIRVNNGDALVAVEPIDGKLINRAHNNLFVENNKGSVKQVDLDLKNMSTRSLLSVRMTSNQRKRSEQFSLHVLLNKYVLDFSSRTLFLVNIFTKEKYHLLAFEEPYFIEEVMLHGLMLFVLISKHEKKTLYVYKLEKQKKMYVAINHLKIILEDKQDVEKASFFDGFNVTELGYNYSASKHVNEYNIIDLKVNWIKFDAVHNVYSYRIRSLHLKPVEYKLHLVTHMTGYLVLMGQYIQLFCPQDYARRLGKLKTSREFSQDVRFKLIEGTDNFFLFDQNQVFYVTLKSKITSDCMELKLYACGPKCERFKTQGQLLCMLDKQGQLDILQFDGGDEVKPFKLNSLMVQKGVANFWFSSCSGYVIYQDMSQVLLVINIATRSVTASFPLFKQIRGFYATDDLVLAALENGTLASLLILNDQDLTKNSKKMERIVNIKPTEDKQLDEYLNKMDDLMLDKNLNRTCFTKYDKERLKGFIDTTVRSDSEFIPSENEKLFERTLAHKDFQTAVEEEVSITSLGKKEHMPDDAKLGRRKKIIKNIKTKLESQRARFGERSCIKKIIRNLF